MGLALHFLVPWAVVVGGGRGCDGGCARAGLPWPQALLGVPDTGRRARGFALTLPAVRAAPWMLWTAQGRECGGVLAPRMRLRGGGKTKSTRPRSWKEQSKFHAGLRKKSIHKNRGKNPQEATYTKEARENIRKVTDERRLRELEENRERKRRMAEERGTDVNHLLRLEYMRMNEEADRRRAEKYQTLEDFSDSVERELEELRQKRGESRCLTIPDWRDGHPGYWKAVEKEVQGAGDIDDPEKVDVRPVRLSQLLSARICKFEQRWRSLLLTAACAGCLSGVEIRCGGR